MGNNKQIGFKRISCPACGKELIRLEPFEEDVYDFWCDTCDIDINISVNAKENKTPYDLLFNTPDAARKVLITMKGIVDYYGCATVADLYDLIDKDASYEMNSQGWTSLKGVDVVRVKDGYTINFPKPITIK